MPQWTAPSRGCGASTMQCQAGIAWEAKTVPFCVSGEAQTMELSMLLLLLLLVLTISKFLVICHFDVSN